MTWGTFSTGYMDDALFSLERVIADAEQYLVGLDFDVFVGTGLSGALVIPSLALSYEKKFAIVRKPRDDSHHGGDLVGNLDERWLFVDDFIGTGSTRNRVRAVIQEASLNRGITTQEVGSYLYSARDGRRLRIFGREDY